MMRLETSLYNLWVQRMTWICRQRRHLRPCNPWQKKPSQGSCFHRAPSLTISGLIMFYHVLSILFSRLQCVNVLEPTTLGFCAFLQKAMSGVLHEQVLGTCRSKGPEATNTAVMCCAVLWFDWQRLKHFGKPLSLDATRWDSLRLVETWELAQRISKVHTFSFSDSFSNLYNLFLKFSKSFSMSLCFLSAAHRWDCLGAPHLTGERPKGVGQKAQGWICWNLLKGAHVSCCLMMSHISSSLCHCTCPSSLLQWLQTLQCYTATLASAFGPDSSVQAVWSPRSSSLVFSL